jgi:hypothetical protein
MRCYNGCPDSELKALWEERARVKAEARAEGILLTWYPAEEKWGASKLEDYTPLGELHQSIHGALFEARRTLRDPHAAVAGAALAAGAGDRPRDASAGPRKASAARALGLPYGQQPHR